MEHSTYDAMIWLFVLWHYSSIIVVPVYVLVMKRVRILSGVNDLPVYIISMWTIYFGSLYGTFYYLTPKINKIIYGFEAHVMGFVGDIEDYFIQLTVLLPLYIVVTKVFETSFKSRTWHVLYFLLYYSVNFALWTGYNFALPGI